MDPMLALQDLPFVNGALSPFRDLFADDRLYELRVGPLGPDAIRVDTFTGSQAMNGLYAFDLDVHLSAGGEVDLDALLGEPARFALAFGGGARAFEGVVAAVEARGEHVEGGAVGRLRIVPRMARLQHTQNSRVFQRKTVLEIVDGVLGEHGIAREWATTRPYPVREYCVQYQESDYDFVTRMLAEDGILFFFRQREATIDEPFDLPEGDVAPDAARTETLVLLDEVAAHPELPGGGALVYRHGSAAQENESSVGTFSFRKKEGAESVLMREYDFRRPMFQLARRASEAPSARDRADAPSAQIYDHHAEYVSPELERNTAPTRLEQHRRALARGAGTSACRRLEPGHVFFLEQHPDAALNRAYVVTSIECQGHSSWVDRTDTPNYEATFRCVPADVPFRPARPARVPRQMVETAVVVGPADETIHTDELGRIRVQFHWDREGQRNQYSSCFIRVVQTWAGPGWGFQFIPRVGMEVLVGFIGGDLDNPVVLGALNNALTPPVYPLPSERTWSGIRTQSTGGGDGFNELGFNDQAGAEEVYLRAQRDLRELVQRDRSAEILANDATRVALSQTVRVGKDQRTSVCGDQEATIAGSRTTSVNGDGRETVFGHKEQVVGKDHDVSVGRDERRVVGGSARETIKGDATRKIAGDATTLVAGETPRAAVHHVEGTSRFTSSGLTEITSTTEVVIRCGKSVLRIMPDAIELVAPEIRVRSPGAGIRFAEKKLELRAKHGATIKADEVVLESPTARVKLDTNASVEAPEIKLNCSDTASDEAKDESEKPTKVELRDAEEKPIGHQHYVVHTKKYGRIGGMVGADGKDEIVLEDGDELEFPELGKVGEV